MDYKAKIGSYVKLDGAVTGKCLLSGDDGFGSWAGCDFRWPNPIPEWEECHAIACNVKVTGRTIQRRNGSGCVRVCIEWVGDGEPNTYSRGYMFI